MDRLRQILKSIFFLPPIPTILIALPSFFFVFYVLAFQIQGIAAYISYGLSAYAMIITVTGVIGIIRVLRGGIHNHPLMEKVLSHPYGERFLKDAAFRTEISLYQGFFVNLIYIIMKMASGIYYNSFWFISLAAYYSLLAVMRFLLLRHVNKNTAGANMIAELHRYRLCGIMLLMMNLVLTGIVGYMVYQNRGYEYPGMLIYAVAAYAFYTIGVAVVSLIKFRKYGSPVLSAAKAINFVAAMVSILALETAMLAQFGAEDDLRFRQMMTGATGGGICVIVLGMAVFMIVNPTKRLKEMKVNNSKM